MSEIEEYFKFKGLAIKEAVRIEEYRDPVAMANWRIDHTIYFTIGEVFNGRPANFCIVRIDTKTERVKVLRWD